MTDSPHNPAYRAFKWRPGDDEWCVGQNVTYYPDGDVSSGDNPTEGFTSRGDAELFAYAKNAASGSPLLGLATTRQLLEEIMARGQLEDYYRQDGTSMALGAARLLDDLPGSMLDYRTVDIVSVKVKRFNTE